MYIHTFITLNRAAMDSRLSITYSICHTLYSAILDITPTVAYPEMGGTSMLHYISHIQCILYTVYQAALYITRTLYI